MQTPTIGRIVHYTLTEQDAVAINQRRADAVRPQLVPAEDGGTTQKRLAEQRLGAVIHAGNQVAEGDVYPLVITRVWNETPGTVNGQILLDGNDTYWATSRTPGEGPGFYAWPTRS